MRALRRWPEKSERCSGASRWPGMSARRGGIEAAQYRDAVSTRPHAARKTMALSGRTLVEVRLSHAYAGVEGHLLGKKIG